MRTFYDEIVAREELGSGSGRAVRIFMRVVLWGFWTPSLLFDLFSYWRGLGETGTGAFVFWMLFRQALVFLALWFTVALTHGLLVGRRTPPEPKKRKSAGILARDHRGR